MNYEVRIDDKLFHLELDRSEGQWHCKLNGTAINIDAVLTRTNVLSILLEGKAYEIKRELTINGLHLWVGSSHYSAEVRDPRSLRHRKDGTAGNKGPQMLTAAMPGKVVRVLLQEGAQVEAMKMQNEIKSPKAGRIQKIMVATSDAVNAGDLVAIVE